MLNRFLFQLNRYAKIFFSKPYKTLNWIEISESAVLRNMDLFQKLNPNKSIFPVLKSNGYGYGIEQFCIIFGDNSRNNGKTKYEYLAVDSYFEALTIAQHLPKQLVLVMGYIDPDNFQNIQTKNLAFVVGDIDTITKLGQTKRNFTIHLEINTGMNRYGIRPVELQEILDLIKTYPNLYLEGIMNHLANSDSNDNGFNELQVGIFDQCIEQSKDLHKLKYIHTQQSSGSVTATSKYGNTLRVGGITTGFNNISPSHPRYHQHQFLEAPLEYKSTITKVIHLKKNESVGYDCSFVAIEDMVIGVLPIGYYDGIKRILGNNGVVKYVAGQDYFLPIVGRICMNIMMIRLDKDSQNNLISTLPQLGNQVILFSKKPQDPNSLLQLEKQTNIYRLEWLVNIPNTVRRIIVD